MREGRQSGNSERASINPDWQKEVLTKPRFSNLPAVAYAKT